MRCPQIVSVPLLTITAAITLLGAPAAARDDERCRRACRFAIVEATIPQIQAAFREHRLDSRRLVKMYLDRIAAYEPLLNAYLHVNDRALWEAHRSDRRRGCRPRGPLEGIPILLKDNIDTADMPTTAGSVALAGSYPPDDAFLTKKLRAAGAILFGKATLSEFANFLTLNMPAGYSSLGLYGFSPYDPRPLPGGDGRPVLSPGGSSSGSGIAVAANLVTVAIGTETSGSILSPGSANGVVGIKPTVGLVSRDGVVPIAASQDTPGPLARTVADAALVLGALTGVDPADPATLASAGHFHTDYTRFLDPRGLQSARIGVPRAGILDSLPREEAALMEEAIQVLRAQGATVVDPADISTLPALNASPTCTAPGQTECTSVLLYEFKRDLSAYLASLGESAPMRTLADIVAFNEAHPDAALKYGQVLLEAAADIDLVAAKARYEADRARDLSLTREQGIDAVMDRYDLDALILPRNRFANLMGRAGYPAVVVPAGFLPSSGAVAHPMPFGITFTAKAWSEPTLIKLAYAYEQATRFRRAPQSTPELCPEDGRNDMYCEDEPEDEGDLDRDACDPLLGETDDEG